MFTDVTEPYDQLSVGRLVSIQTRTSFLSKSHYRVRWKPLKSAWIFNKVLEIAAVILRLDPGRD